MIELTRRQIWTGESHFYHGWNFSASSISEILYCLGSMNSDQFSGPGKGLIAWEMQQFLSFEAGKIVNMQNCRYLYLLIFDLPRKTAIFALEDDRFTGNVRPISIVCGNSASSSPDDRMENPDKVPYTIIVQTDPMYVDAVYSGVVTPAELVGAADQVLSCGTRGKTLHILADCSAIDTRHFVFDLYGLASWVSAKRDHCPVKEALILPEDERVASDVIFWEAACANKGLCVMVFNDRPSALEWLLA